jgi:hypothetical protein
MWEMAYIMSKHMLHYVGRNPYPSRILFLEKDAYSWIPLELHAISCFYTGRKEEGAWAYWQMRAIVDTFPQDSLSHDQWEKIRINEQFFPKYLVKHPIKPYPVDPAQQNAMPKSRPQIAGSIPPASRQKAKRKRR